MLIKILYFIFVVVLLRFLALTVKAVLSLGGSKGKVASRQPRSSHPAAGQRVVDVDFTEDNPAKPGKEGSK